MSNLGLKKKKLQQDNTKEQIELVERVRPQACFGNVGAKYKIVFFPGEKFTNSLPLSITYFLQKKRDSQQSL